MILYGMFKDGMVLQRNKEILVMGTAEPKQSVKAILKDGEKSLTRGTIAANKSGKFVIKLKKLPEGGPYTLTVTGGEETIEIKDVYIGEVWLAAGQDNMKMPLKHTEDAEAAAKLIRNRRLHYYVVPTVQDIEPDYEKADKKAKWVTINSYNSSNMSAVAYYFALELMTKVDCHIGIIGAFEDGTNAACWQSVKSLEATPEGLNYLNEWNELCSGISETEYKSKLTRYEDARAEWEMEYEKTASRYKGYAYDEVVQVMGEFKREFPYGKWSPRRPGGMFEQKIMRIAPYRIAGVIFYQGESDCEMHSMDYYGVFLSLVKEWRSVFDNDELPFIYCQLHMWIDRDRHYIGLEDFKWPRVRQSQYLAGRSLKNAYMAILTDNGEFINPKPIDKKTPGSRLAFLALKNVYGFSDVPAVSPYLIDLRSVNSGVEMSFSGDFNMLMFKTYGETGFEICGKDGVFHKCDASVDFDGKTISASSPYVLEPRTVRYAYFSYGNTTLSSDTGLAVLPFTRNVIKGLNDLY